MSDISVPRPLPAPQMAAGAVWLVALVAILAALGFEHLGGYEPCPLCLQERWAYYAAIPAGFAAWALMHRGHGRWAMWLLLFCALAFALNGGLGVYHSGVEWKWWPGPTSCSGGSILAEGGNIIDAIRNQRVVRCDEAPWRLFGLSFAGYSALISAGLSLIALWGAVRARR